MSQEGLVSSNHYVVRIYPLALPPVSLFPSLHPSCLFPSLCSLSTGCPTTLQHPPFFNHHRLMHHLSSRFPGTHSFVNSFIFIFCLPTRSLAPRLASCRRSHQQVCPWNILWDRRSQCPPFPSHQECARPLNYKLLISARRERIDGSVCTFTVFIYSNINVVQCSSTHQSLAHFTPSKMGYEHTHTHTVV